MTHRIRPAVAIIVAAVLGTSLSSFGAVDFYKQVYPILKESCISCHGPKKQKGKLRLDTAEWIMKGVKGDAVVVPGKPAESSFYDRVILPHDDDDIMPPEGDGDPLTKAQQALFKNWIQEGAKFGDKPAHIEAAADHGEAKKTVEEILGAKMSKPSEANMKKLTEAGALAATLAQNLNAVRVDFSLAGDKVTDHEIALINGVSDQLVWLNLARTKVTDASLANVAKAKNLTRLHLENTGVTDAGLKHLSGLEHLTYLNLYGTGITDAGLKHLQGAKNLKSLYLWQTKTTKAGVDALKNSLKGATINTGAELTAVPAAAPAAAKAQAGLNAKCPVSGKPINAKQVSTLKQEVAFCCNNCRGKFTKDPASFASKIDLKAKALNTKCPVSGKPAKPNCKAPYEKKVAFCCGNCKKKFDANPAAFVAKLK